MITINYDFTTGDEVSHIEGKRLVDEFETNCTSFFTVDTLHKLKEPEDVLVVVKSGAYLSAREILSNEPGYATYRELLERIQSNIKSITELEEV